jgi:hypothetical protein
LVTIGSAVALGGLLWLKIAFSFEEVAWSIVAVILGVGAIGLAYVSPLPASGGTRAAESDGSQITPSK